jgi:hypothetical protein
LSPAVRLVGPTNTYRLGGEPLINQDLGSTPFPLTDTTLPALPTPDYFTLKDYRDWDLHSDHHHLYVTNQQFSPKLRGAPTTVLTAGDWVVGVTNTEAIPLPAFLAGTKHFGRKWWGVRPGFGGATQPAAYSLRAQLSADPDDMCLHDCGGVGTCKAGVCQCNAGASTENSTKSNAAARAGSGAKTETETEIEAETSFVGEHCEYAAEVLPPGETVTPPLLHIGQWQYFFVPFPDKVGGDVDYRAAARPLVVELAYPRSPAASPMLFATKASGLGSAADIPKLEAACASFWGSGPYGGGSPGRHPQCMNGFKAIELLSS